MARSRVAEARLLLGGPVSQEQARQAHKVLGAALATLDELVDEVDSLPVAPDARGAEYFRQLNAMRKTHGRPALAASTPPVRVPAALVQRGSLGQHDFLLGWRFLVI